MRAWRVDLGLASMIDRYGDVLSVSGGLWVALCGRSCAGEVLLRVRLVTVLRMIGDARSGCLGRIR